MDIQRAQARRPEARVSRLGGWNLSQRDVLHGVFVAVNVLAFVLVQLEVPDPYLVRSSAEPFITELVTFAERAARIHSGRTLTSQDEIFHIPQTQRYCEEDFESWDPAITTPPGL